MYLYLGDFNYIEIYYWKMDLFGLIFSSMDVLLLIENKKVKGKFLFISFWVLFFYIVINCVVFVNLLWYEFSFVLKWNVFCLNNVIVN